MRADKITSNTPAGTFTSSHMLWFSMSSIGIVLGVLLVILAFSAPLCYFAYLGMRDGHEGMMLPAEPAEQK